jgi:hypothetical protein
LGVRLVLSSLSQKFCGVVSLPVSKEVNGVRNFAFPGSMLNPRIYTEDFDRINSAGDDQDDKTLTLVVTPFKKTCKRKDNQYQKCGYRASCVRKELFCDGLVNCAWPDREPTGKQCFVMAW